MKYLSAIGLVVGAFVMGGGLATAAPQATKAARGTVVAVGSDSITVKVKDQDTKFLVDDTTRVVAPGGGTQTRTAQAQGKRGAPIDSILKAGQTVDIEYHEPAMHAASIRVISAVAPAAAGAAATPKSAAASSTDAKPAASKPISVFGIVTAMTGTSLTVRGSSGVTTFVIDDTSKVIGTGLGTQARAAAVAGKRQVLADLIGVGDGVTVTYHNMDGTKHAAEVRLRRKAK